MKTLELELPAHWASALVNGDETGFCNDEQFEFDLFVKWMTDKYGSCWCINVSDNGDGNFRHDHDASYFGTLACDVATFTFDITKDDSK